MLTSSYRCLKLIKMILFFYLEFSRKKYCTQTIKNTHNQLRQRKWLTSQSWLYITRGLVGVSLIYNVFFSFWYYICLNGMIRKEYNKRNCLKISSKQKRTNLFNDIDYVLQIKYMGCDFCKVIISSWRKVWPVCRRMNIIKS